MKVFQVKSITSSVIPQRTLRERVSEFTESVRCRLSSKYAQKVADRNMQEIKELYLKAHPELVERGKAVKNFMKSSYYALPKLNDETLSVMTAKSGELLKTCGNNILKIYNLMGAYGLKLYCSIGLSHKDILGTSEDCNILEKGYYSDKKFKQTFDEYLDSNDRGSVNDIYRRFGQCGKSLYERYLLTGCVREVSSKSEDKYCTTDDFDLLVRNISLPVGEEEYRMQQFRC